MIRHNCKILWKKYENLSRIGCIVGFSSLGKHRRKGYRFIDKVKIEVRGGKGGNGCVSYEILAPGRKRPNGGSGGRGGNVYLVADKSLTTMSMTTFHFNAPDGAHGSSDRQTGRQGRDVYVKVPCGTVVTELLEGYIENEQEGGKGYDMLGYDDDDGDNDGDSDGDGDGDNGDGDNDDDMNYANTSHDIPLHKYEGTTIDLDQHNDMLLVATGGKPGIGNGMMKGTLHRNIKSMPTTKNPGII
jgi:GTPase involved in cell partitioning and DNA repair